MADPLSLAVSHIETVFHGKEAHASSFPEEGINALDAFVQSYVNLSTLRQHILPTDKIHGIITEGGKAPNIVPALTRSKWYVRSSTLGRLDVLEQRARDCFEAAAMATGCRVQIEHFGHKYANMVSDPLLTELFIDNSRALGRSMVRGADRPIAERGSTDMGNVSHVIPSIQPMLSLNCRPVGNHQPAFAEHTVTEDGHRVITDGASAMAWTAIDVAAGDLWDRLATRHGPPNTT